MRSLYPGTSVLSITWMINEQMKMEKPVSGCLRCMRLCLEQGSLFSCRVTSGALNPKNILGAFGVKGTQYAEELAKGGSNRGRVGHFDLEHGQMRHMTDMVVQEEVEIALDELVVRVECNVLGLPEP